MAPESRCAVKGAFSRWVRFLPGQLSFRPVAIGAVVHADTALQELHQRDNQAPLGDQRADQPFRKIGLHRLDGRPGLLSQGLDVGLGREVAVEQGDMLLGQGLGLLLGETALRQSLDEAVGIERDGLGHAPIIGSIGVLDKDLAPLGRGRRRMRQRQSASCDERISVMRFTGTSMRLASEATGYHTRTGRSRRRRPAAAGERAVSGTLLRHPTRTMSP